MDVDFWDCSARKKFPSPKKYSDSETMIHISQQKVCCDSSLEPSCQDGSDKLSGSKAYHALFKF